MDRFGKWGIRVAALVVAVFFVNACISWYLSASQLEREYVWGLAKIVMKIGLIGSITFCIGLLLALGLWASRAPKLDDRTRTEVHHATED
jgi:type VI protein secretion system component VasK